MRQATNPRVKVRIGSIWASDLKFYFGERPEFRQATMLVNTDFANFRTLFRTLENLGFALEAESIEGMKAG